MARVWYYVSPVSKLISTFHNTSVRAGLQALRLFSDSELKAAAGKLDYMIMCLGGKSIRGMIRLRARLVLFLEDARHRSTGTGGTMTGVAKKLKERLLHKLVTLFSRVVRLQLQRCAVSVGFNKGPTVLSLTVRHSSCQPAPALAPGRLLSPGADPRCAGLLAVWAELGVFHLLLMPLSPAFVHLPRGTWAWWV